MIPNRRTEAGIDVESERSWLARFARATDGPWKWHTSNSWRRLRRNTYRDESPVLEPFTARDGHPDCMISAADMELIEAAPDLLLKYGEALDEIADLRAKLRDAEREKSS